MQMHGCTLGVHQGTPLYAKLVFLTHRVRASPALARPRQRQPRQSMQLRSAPEKCQFESAQVKNVDLDASIIDKAPFIEKLQSSQFTQASPALASPRQPSPEWCS